jgi:micrococcal nuclease
MRALSSAVLAVMLAGCGSSPSLPSALAEPPVASMVQNVAEPSVAVVSKVTDGDTIRVAGESAAIRILGIDSPETVDPHRPVQCGGPESSDWAKLQLPLESRVRLVPDRTQDSEDIHGRLLRYVEFEKDGQWLDFSVESARAGMSRVYVFRGKKVQRHDQIAAAEAEARSAGRGLWGHC